MADINVARKPGGGQNTWLWMLLALVAVVGLMIWLSVASQRTTTTIVAEERGDPAATGGVTTPGAAEPGDLGTIAAGPEPFVGQRLRFSDVEVAATLGPSAFWGDVPGANPFLVMFSPDMTEQPQLAAGERYTIQGTVNVVTDELIDNWVQSGAIRAGARDEAAFASHYLLAEVITR